MERDILQKIAEESNDRTALSILSSNKRMYNDHYFSIIFGKRYPDLIKYKKEQENIKHFYLRMLQIIGLLKEEFNYTYSEGGDPEKILLTFLDLRLDIKNMLVKSIVKKSLPLFKYVLKYGGDISDGLFWASRIGVLPIVKYSIEHGAGANSKEMALLHAASFGHLEVVKYLIENGINTEINNALNEASQGGHLEVVKYLIENGADIHVNNDYPLEVAAINKYLEMVKYLVEHGANLEAAFRYTNRNERKKIMRYINR